MKVAVFYYTQSGQALSVAESICRTMDDTVFVPIVTKHVFPFPWSREAFFDVFPETRLGLPPAGIQPINFTDVEDADVVMVVGQSWFLSPSLPLQSFFTDQRVKDYLRGRNVVFVNACRNMWLMTSRKVKCYIQDAHAHLVGHIVMQDERPNLVSALTIIRWLMYGKKTKGCLLPAAGISNNDINEASRFGEIISQEWGRDALSTLQDRLLAAGAIHYKPSILFLEKAGHRMFGFWAAFVRKKGGFGDQHRRFRLNLFYAYLLVVLFLLSPFAQLFFYLTYPLHHVSRSKQADCGV